MSFLYLHVFSVAMARLSFMAYSVLPCAFLSMYLIVFRSAAAMPAYTDSSWTEWVRYMQITSTSQNFTAAKSVSSNAQFRFTEDSCLMASSTLMIDGSLLEMQHKFVAINGSGNFTTLQTAIDSIPRHNKIPILICIAAGIYREKVLIPKTKDLVTLIGDTSGNGTVIVWNDTAATVNPQSKHPLRTYNSSTMAVNAEFFVARNIIFQNDAPAPVLGEEGGQAVALRISGDYAAFYNCKFLGHQDTLYDQKGRHYFKRCFIQGSVDFIFGNGRSLYKECYVRALTTGYNSVGSVTAQKRGATKFDSGFAFLQCNLTGDSNVYLGRAWGPDSRVIFAYTWMDHAIVPEGWNDWGIPAREKTVFYGEFNCSGPGADSSTRVPWARQLTPEEAQPFLSVGFINGETWLLEI